MVAIFHNVTPVRYSPKSPVFGPDLWILSGRREGLCCGSPFTTLPRRSQIFGANMVDAQSSISVIVLDRSPIFLEGLRALFARTPSLNLRCACASASAAVTELAHQPAAILLVSAQFAVPDAVLLARRVCDVSPSTRIIFLANSDEFSAVVSRSKAISSVFIVSRAIEPDRLAWVVSTIATDNDVPRDLCGGGEPPAIDAGRGNDCARLTSRETEISRLVGEGLSNKHIAEHTRIREGTVKVHLYNIFQKLGVTNRVGLIRMLEMH